MIARVAFFLLMSLGLIGFGTVAWITTRPAPTAASAPPAQTLIMMAGQPIQAGSLLTAEELRPKAIPTSQMSKEYNIDTPDSRRGLMGAMVKRNLAAGEAIRNDDLIRPSDHGFMAAVLSPGMRAVTINLDPASGASGLIWPGDRVDLILTQMSNDPATPIGRRISAHTVLSDVRVVAVDSQLISAPNRNSNANGDNQNRTVTLEVDEDQAQRVAVAMRLGKLSVAVRAASSVAGKARTPTSQDATFASDVLPDLAAKPAPPAVAPTIVMARPPAPVEPPMRVFSGPNETKEFKF
jgi:pilus assembly protein CpaB